MEMKQVRIYVTYKQSVFDPQGETIKESIQTMGHTEIKKVKVGKFFDVTIDLCASDLEQIVKSIAEEMLVNFNLETYRYEILEEA
ncbi:hypothetical protein FC36_GL000971 [Ligilactobacillus equi DSM 15833 = JCM 10991]|uniref:Phosphoribosylformylglycinamidine synthase subunit PurS n=2 Tax=Ligilactobacillus equi TaxID=137357 RepID=A0A0R1TBI3_9LACO|nr:hypothetical protein FC36_GL000971 [Ligilactobacillus equi DSM 15833 = JCM 10991]